MICLKDYLGNIFVVSSIEMTNGRKVDLPFDIEDHVLKRKRLPNSIHLQINNKRIETGFEPAFQPHTF